MKKSKKTSLVKMVEHPLVEKTSEEKGEKPVQKEFEKINQFEIGVESQKECSKMIEEKIDISVHEDGTIDEKIEVVVHENGDIHEKINIIVHHEHGNIDEKIDIIVHHDNGNIDEKIELVIHENNEDHNSIDIILDIDVPQKQQDNSKGEGSEKKIAEIEVDNQSPQNQNLTKESYTRSEKPKRPLTGYNIWAKEKGRPTILKEYPKGKYPGGVGYNQYLGQLWGEVDENQKDDYNQKSRKKLNVYNTELEAWTEANPHVDDGRRRSKTRGKRSKREDSEEKIEKPKAKKTRNTRSAEAKKDKPKVGKSQNDKIYRHEGE